MTKHRTKLEIWERSRNAAREALEALRENGDYSRTSTHKLNALITRAYAAYDPYAPRPGQKRLGNGVRISSTGMSDLAALRVMIADNHPKEKVLDLLDYIMSRKNQ